MKYGMSTSATTIERHVSLAKWRDGEVFVTGDEPCEHKDLATMHHLGDDGRHYCPTGFLWCPDCCGIAIDHEPECHLWSETA